MMAGSRRPEGFDELYDRTFRRAEGLARRLVGRADAEDVAIEALARALANWENVARLPHLDAWVLRVAANVALDHIRREHRRARLRPSPAGAAAGSDEGALRVTLQAALAALPRRQGQVLALRYLADLPEDQVAAALGLSLGTVKTHARRALSTLRARLGDEREALFHAG